MCYNFNTLLQQKGHFIQENRMLILRPVSHNVGLHSNNDWPGVRLQGGRVLAKHGTTEQPIQSTSSQFSQMKLITVHRSRDDPRKECESCGNARFRERQ
jgi:hypothetical protein